MAFSDLLEKVKNSVLDNEEENVSEDSSFFAEEVDALPPDPKPARASNSKTVSPKRVTVAAKPSVKVKKEIKDTLTLMITLPGGVLNMRDPHCGGILVMQAEAIADALVPIICRNPTMYAYFTAGGNSMDYFTLLMALMPVAQTFIQHHIKKTIDDGEEEDLDYSLFQAPVFD